MDRHNCPSPYQQKSNYERKLQLERDIVRAKASFDNLKEDLAKARIEKEYLLKSIYSTEVRISIGLYIKILTELCQM